MGYFGSTLARSWYMADHPPSQSDLSAQFEWVSLLLSDQNKVRAAGLHAVYYQCRSQITNDRFALEALEQQHYNLECRITPLYRLPAEIMMEIFHIVLDVGQLRGGLMHVCRRWCKIIEGMASIWASLDLGAWTTPEKMQHLLSRAGTHPLAVKIDIDKTNSMARRLRPSFDMVGDKASQWRTLIIASLPQDGSDAQSNHALLPIQLRPMRQLRHLNITEPVLSPLLRLLLQNVATAAVGELTSMEIHSFPAVQYILQPAHSSICCSLTTFIAKVPKTNQPVDLLPHFMQLEVLELTNLLLPILDNNSPLPLTHTLRHLYLKSVSIQWMGGRAFSQIEKCTIIAPLTGPSPHHDVQLPACTAFHFENWNISPIGQFSAPALDHLRAKSNAWSPYTGNGQVVQFVRAGFGIGLQPKSLSFSVTCTEKMLLTVLKLLPELVELKLDLLRPSAIGKHFFTELLAKPGSHLSGKLKFDWRELFREIRTGWECTICPSLRILELKYHKWLRPGDNDDFLPPLLALSWSREKTATPLQSHVHYKASVHSWKSLNSIRPHVIEVLSCLTVPQQSQITQLSLQTPTWKNDIFENALIMPFLYRLQVLQITNHSSPERLVLNVLPSLRELRDLQLSSVHVSPHNVDLPLVHTLRKLCLKNTTLAWMDGLVFTQLQRFAVNESGWPETFKRTVGMPACTHIVFMQDKLKTLPVLHSHFHFPLLNTFELPFGWKHSKYDEGGIRALKRIHAKVFKFWIISDHLGLLESMESKDDVEALELVIASLPASPITAAEVLTRFSVTNLITRTLPCPNMKVLRLQFANLMGEDREKVIQLCTQMMNKRRLAGCSLEKCYLWWRHWERAASLALAMENDMVRIEG